MCFERITSRTHLHQTICLVSYCFYNAFSSGQIYLSVVRLHCRLYLLYRPLENKHGQIYLSLAREGLNNVQCIQCKAKVSLFNHHSKLQQPQQGFLIKKQSIMGFSENLEQLINRIIKLFFTSVECIVQYVVTMKS